MNKQNALVQFLAREDRKKYRGEIAACTKSIKDEHKQHRIAVRMGVQRVAELAVRIASDPEVLRQFRESNKHLKAENTFVAFCGEFARSLYAEARNVKDASKLGLIIEFLLLQRVRPDRIADVVKGATLERLKRASAKLRKTGMNTGRTAPKSASCLTESKIQDVVERIEAYRGPHDLGSRGDLRNKTVRVICRPKILVALKEAEGRGRASVDLLFEDGVWRCRRIRKSA